MTGNERSKRTLSLIICIGLFVAAVAGYLLFGGSRQSASPSAGGVRVTEIMADNKTYFDPNGKALDYIEVSNLTDKAVDITVQMIRRLADI